MSGPVLNNDSKHIGVKLLMEYTKIPVWPVTCTAYLKGSFPSYCPLMEDDNGRVAFVSQEAKDRFIEAVKGGCKSAEAMYRLQALQKA